MRNTLLAILGFFTPASYTAPLYLRSRLQMHGVDLARVPDRCIRELSSYIVEGTKLHAEIMQRSWRAEITDNIDTDANLIAALMFGEPEVAELSRPEIDSILNRYGLLGTLAPIPAR